MCSVNEKGEDLLAEIYEKIIYPSEGNKKVAEKVERYKQEALQPCGKQLDEKDFEQLEDCVYDLLAIAEKEACILGFRFGVKFMSASVGKI